ncbi:unnamed protein product [Closterium sp. Naga37s-1]|nr:unnamed protein product [Closterium sp. Naga37s-1]
MNCAYPSRWGQIAAVEAVAQTLGRSGSDALLASSPSSCPSTMGPPPSPNSLPSSTCPTPSIGANSSTTVSRLTGGKSITAPPFPLSQHLLSPSHSTSLLPLVAPPFPLPCRTSLPPFTAPPFPLSQHLPSPSHSTSLSPFTATPFPLSQHLPSPFAKAL